MGVKGLFQLVSPHACLKVPISKLEGQTIAVDLSSWIVESRNVKVAQQGYDKLYLRNLFFRCSALMSSNIKLVFVLEGDAPESKMETMRYRAEGYSSKSQDHNFRSFYDHVQKKSAELLDSLGLPWIQAPNEAEAYCAGLCLNQTVDAVMTSDSDVFLYGARRVYRKLGQENKVWIVQEMYDMEDIEKGLNLDRDSLIAMALLVGCDYSRKGIQDIGIEIAQKLFKEIRRNGNYNVLDRIKNWPVDTFLQNVQDSIDSSDKAPAHCSKCGHAGTSAHHDKCGCVDCNTKTSCKPSTASSATPDCSCGSQIHNQQKYKLELRCRQKALQDTNFTTQVSQVVSEFKEGSTVGSIPSLQWSEIDVPKLKSFLSQHLKWSESDIFDRVSTLLVNVQMNLDTESKCSKENFLSPIRVMRECIKNEIPCIEVEWNSHGCDKLSKSYPILVEKAKFSRHHPQLLEKYMKEKEMEKLQKNKKGSKRKINEVQSNKVTDFFPVKKKPSYQTSKGVSSETASSSRTDVSDVE